MVGQRDPALALLAGDVGEPGLALGVEAVELLLQALLGRLPGVDRAPELAGGPRAHLPPPWRFTPKKVSPFQRVPVIARATALRLLYRRPSHSKPSASTVTLCSTPRHSRISCVPDDRPVHHALPGRLRIEPVGQRVELGPGRGLEPAVGQLLDPVGEPADQVVAAEPRRLLVEQLAPHLLELGRGRLRQGRHLRGDAVGHALRLR